MLLRNYLDIISRHPLAFNFENHIPSYGQFDSAKVANKKIELHFYIY